MSELAGEITRLHKEAERNKVEAINNGRAAVAAAVNCGKLLLRVKKLVGHGKWLRWLADNCPEISDSTAQNWMRVASNPQVLGNLEGFNSLKQLYQAVGIMPLPQKANTLSLPVVDIYSTVASNVAKKIQSGCSLLNDVPINEWPQEQRDALKEKLKPAVQLYEQLSRE